MIETIVTFIEHTLVPYGALGVFLASAIEEIVAPIPSALVLLVSGFVFLHSVPFSLSYIGILLFVVVIPATLGMTAGSLLMYSIGYVSGKPAIVKFGKYFGISWSDVEKAEARFAHSNTDEIALILLRAIPVVPNTAVSALCGLIRFPLTKYLTISIIGLGLRAFVLVLIGAQVGSLYDHYEMYFEQAENYVLAFFTVIALVLFFILYARKRSRANRR